MVPTSWVAVRVEHLWLASLTTDWLSVVWRTPRLSPCRQFGAGEPAQGRRLRHRDGPVVYLDPAAPLETAQRGVDALPGAADLMRQFLLAQLQPNGAILAAGLAEQHLRHSARKIKEDQVGRRVGQATQGSRDGHREGLRRGRHPRADLLDCLAWDQEQLAFVEGLGVAGPGTAVGDAEFTEHAAGTDDRQRERAAVCGADRHLDPAGHHHDHGVTWVTPGEHHLAAPEGTQPGGGGQGAEILSRNRAKQGGLAQDVRHVRRHRWLPGTAA